MGIPPQLGDAFLHTEVVSVHGRWRIYRDLYGSSPERIDLLNQTAPTFFAILQGIWLNAVQLTLSKLADPATTFKRTNLTLLSNPTRRRPFNMTVRHAAAAW